MTITISVGGRRAPIKSPMHGVQVIAQVLRAEPSAKTAAALGRAVCVVTANAVGVIAPAKRGAISTFSTFVRAVSAQRWNTVASQAVLIGIQWLGLITGGAGLRRRGLTGLFAQTFQRELETPAKSVNDLSAGTASATLRTGAATVETVNPPPKSCELLEPVAPLAEEDDISSLFEDDF